MDKNIMRFECSSCKNGSDKVVSDKKRIITLTVLVSAVICYFLVASVFADNNVQEKNREIGSNGKSIHESVIPTADGPAEFIKITKVSMSDHYPLADPKGRPVKEFTFVVDDLELEIAPDVFVDVWAFALEGQKPSVPGPELRVMEGDFVRVFLKNTHAAPHTMHFHGINAPFHSDGVPDFSQNPVEADEMFIYEFVAKRTGTHLYHCHFQTLLHMDMGMYGAIIVEPRDVRYKADRDIVWFLDEWSVIPEGKEWYQLAGAGMNGQYNYFTINSISWPDFGSAITNVRMGEKIRVRLINVGYKTHSIHFHGHKSLVTHFDGYPSKDPILLDTVSVSPGQRIDLLIEANNPGIFPVHCHVLPHVTNDGDYPGGMLTAMVYEGFTIGEVMKKVDAYGKRHFPIKEFENK